MTLTSPADAIVTASSVWNLLRLIWWRKLQVWLKSAMPCARWSTTLPDGREQSGYFAANFTLAELETLYARQAIAGRDLASRQMYRCTNCCHPSASGVAPYALPSLCGYAVRRADA